MPTEKIPANFNRYPYRVLLPKNTRYVCLGDLHGNAFKLIYQLLQLGIIKLSEQCYSELRALYEQPIETISIHSLRAFEANLEKMSVDGSRVLILIGDEVADRGKLDLYTLLVLSKLQRQGLVIEIVISNHGAEFILAYEKGNAYDPEAVLPGEFKASLLNTHYLIETYPKLQSRLANLIEEYYWPCLKLLNYAFDSNSQELTLFCHAPISLNTIRHMAFKLNLPYAEHSPQGLMDTIDTLNRVVSNHIKAKRFHRLFDEQWLCYLKQSSLNYNHTLSAPLIQMTWNRLHIPFEETQPENRSFHVTHIHGHLGPVDEPASHAHINLDEYNELGKWSENKTGFNYLAHDRALTAFDIQLQQQLGQLSHEERIILHPSFEQLPSLALKALFLTLKLENFPELDEVQCQQLCTALVSFTEKAGCLPQLPKIKMTLKPYLEQLTPQDRAPQIPTHCPKLNLNLLLPEKRFFPKKDNLLEDYYLFLSELEKALYRCPNLQFDYLPFLKKAPSKPPQTADDLDAFAFHVLCPENPLCLVEPLLDTESHRLFDTLIGLVKKERDALINLYAFSDALIALETLEKPLDLPEYLEHCLVRMKKLFSDRPSCAIALQSLLVSTSQHPTLEAFTQHMKRENGYAQKLMALKKALGKASPPSATLPSMEPHIQRMNAYFETRPKPQKSYSECLTACVQPLPNPNEVRPPALLDAFLRQIAPLRTIGLFPAAPGSESLSPNETAYSSVQRNCIET